VQKGRSKKAEVRRQKAEGRRENLYRLGLVASMNGDVIAAMVHLGVLWQREYPIPREFNAGFPPARE
jgi:hypothetical protein